MTPTMTMPAFRWDWLRGPGVKLALLAGLLLVMQVPAALVSSVIDERESRQDGVRTEIAQSWGPSQTLFGPVLVVPWEDFQPVPPPVPLVLPNLASAMAGNVATPAQALEMARTYTQIQQSLANQPPPPPIHVTGSIQVLPQRLDATVHLTPEQRRRGVFGAVVYASDIALAGNFTMPELPVPGRPGAKLLWQDAFVMVGGSDLRGAPAATALDWDGSRHDGTEDIPVGESCGEWSVMGWRLRLAAAPSVGQVIPFATSFPLRGTSWFRLAPLARDVAMTIDAPWATPSFDGATLPAHSDVTATSFHAEWRGGVGVRQATWPVPDHTCGGDLLQTAQTQASGVDLLEAVPTYRMVTRASKYSALFLALSFLTYFMFEMLTRTRINLVQYGLLGLSVSLFGLLLLAIAEPLGFGPAYAIATAAVLAQATVYTAAVTGRLKLTLTFGATLGGLFGFLYIVLQQESYSLLSGAVALFAILSVVMAVTRKLDWSAAAPGTEA